MNHCDPFTLSDNLLEVCLIQTRKGPNNCLNVSVGHYLTWHQSYCAIFSETPTIPVVFNTNAKMQNNVDFWITSIFSTAVNLKMSLCFFLSVLLCSHDMP